MTNFVVDFDSVEETIEDGEKNYFIKVYAIDERYPFPSEMQIDRYMWDFHGNGFLSGAELNQFGAKATYKLRLKEKKEVKDKGFQL